MPEANGVASEGRTHREVMVWIENTEGAIARGVAESVTTAGAQVRLSEPPAFAQGAQVSLRISFDREAPTVAATARVSFVRTAGAAAECGLEWTVPAKQRGAFEAWLAAA